MGMRWGAALALVVASGDALACGGLFCSSPLLPVEQTGERIVFALDEEAGKVEVQVQIAYEGPAEAFAWVVPMPEPPAIGIATQELFDALDRTYGPTFRLTFDLEGCDVPDADTGGGFAGGGGGSGGGGGGGLPGGDGVEVFSEALVGPYATAVLRADTPELLLTWLDDNGYLVPADVGSALAPYVSGGSWFVALRLQKDRDVGELAPIRLTYAASEAVIPITLTRVAATPDMGLIVHVLGSGRAVPDNYLHVVPNPFRIDWWNQGANYQALVGEAADEAGGQAFATDYAGTPDALEGTLVWPGRFDEAALRAAGSPEELVAAVARQGFVRDEALIAVLERHLGDVGELWPASPWDTGLPSDTALVIPDTDTDADTDADTGLLPVDPPFDPDPVVDELVASFIEPLRHAEALLARHPWLTRLSSSMSPVEMTQDPLFVLNEDMGDVPARRVATLLEVCDLTGESDTWLEIDGVRVPLPAGSGGLGGGGVARTWLDAVYDFAALRIEDTSARGEPVVIVDRADAFAAPPPPEGSDPLDVHPPWGVADDADGACGCASTAPGGGAGLAFLAIGLLARRRGARGR